MKKLISILLLLPSLVFGAVQNDIVVGRVQANGFSTILDYITTAKNGEMQFIMFDGSGLVNTVRKVGPSISCGPVYCDAVAGAVNWSSIVGVPTFAQVAYTGDYNDLANKPFLFSGAYADLTGKPTLFSGAYSALTGIPSTFAPAAHNQAWSTITSTPTTLAGYGITDAATSASVTSGLATKADTSALTSGLAGKQNTITLTTTGTGAASLVGATLNIPTPAAATPFNFSQPTARTLSVSTSYQASDPSKAAIIYPSYSCQNATTVLAASGCTIQVRIGTGTLTCSTGTVYYTQSLTVALGVLITQSSVNPVPIFLPTGASFILCPTTGTFTVTTVEQSVG